MSSNQPLPTSLNQLSNTFTWGNRTFLPAWQRFPRENPLYQGGKDYPFLTQLFNTYTWGNIFLSFSLASNSHERILLYQDGKDYPFLTLPFLIPSNFPIPNPFLTSTFPSPHYPHLSFPNLSYSYFLYSSNPSSTASQYLPVSVILSSTASQYS